MTTQEHLQTSQSETTPPQGQPSPPTLEATQNPPPTTSKSTQLVPKATTQHGPLAEPPHPDPPLHDSEDETQPLPSPLPEDNPSPHQPESPTERDGVSHTPPSSSNYKHPIQESSGEPPGHKHNGQPPGQKPIGQSPGEKTGGQHPAPTVSESTSSQKSTQADAKSSDATTPELARAEAEAIPKQKYTQLFGDQTKKLNTLDSDQPSHPNQKEKEEKEKQDHPSGADSGLLQDTNRHPLEASHRKRGSSDTHTAPEHRQPKPESGAEGESQVNKVIKVAGYVTNNYILCSATDQKNYATELCEVLFERSRNALLYTHLYKACSQHKDIELKYEKCVMRSVFHVNFSHSHTVVATQTNT